MKVLVIGGTGKVGTEVVKALLSRGVSVRVLTRNKEAKLAAGVEASVGNLLDPDSMRAALQGIDKLFLLVANAADELTQALLAFDVARETRIKHLTYLSVYQAERFPDVPHFIAKDTVENTLKSFEIPFTIVRPGYFYQNDAALRSPISGAGLYPVPLGTAGIAAVDVRDIAEVAAISLTTDGHAGKTYNLVGHAPLSGPQAAAIWAKALGRPVRYAEPSFDGFEKQLRQMVPHWHAMELRLMFQRYHERGFAPTLADVAEMTKLFGRSPRSYEDFVGETAAAWANG